MAGWKNPAGIRLLVYGMGKGKGGIEGLERVSSPERRHKSGPRRARTVDPRIKSPLLYRLSYRPHYVKRSTIEINKPANYVKFSHLTPISES